jgi:NAD(P)H-dependent FMN reductase
LPLPLGKRNGVETELIDIAKLPLPTNDAGEAIKHADFSFKMNKADALVIVSPEYNHGCGVVGGLLWRE